MYNPLGLVSKVNVSLFSDLSQKNAVPSSCQRSLLIVVFGKEYIEYLDSGNVNAISTYPNASVINNPPTKYQFFSRVVTSHS